MGLCPGQYPPRGARYAVPPDYELPYVSPQLLASFAVAWEAAQQGNVDIVIFPSGDWEAFGL